MSRGLLPKIKGDVYVGFLPSESNPPTMVEFLDGLQCMAAFALDKILYTVIDGESSDRYFEETRRHRLSMAKSAAAMYGPLFQVADLGDGEPCAREELAFRLFNLNPDLKFTLAIYPRRSNEPSESTRSHYSAATSE